ncbi:MAG: hypothetical protein QXN37_02110 [Candidatus Anstonellaceae archaeon]
MAKAFELIEERAIYIFVVILLGCIILVVWLFHSGKIDVEAARIYLQALTGIATLALLYFAYFNVMSKKEEDTARLELAVRPILVWELQSKNSGAEFIYKALKHPIYDLQASIQLNNEIMRIEERHLDAADSNPWAERKIELGSFILKGLGKNNEGTIRIRFSYHSEVGGKYEFSFTKEVVRKQKGFLFQHRKIVSAKYPWKQKEIEFSNDL